MIWSDNTGAEASTRKGSAKEFDHLSLVHGIWLRAAELNLELFVKRVPTKDNIADDPSRERYDLIMKLPNIVIEKAFLDDVFLLSQTWEALSVVHVFD